jgi:hypothetical protein
MVTFRSEVMSYVHKRSEQKSIKICTDIFKRKFSMTEKHVCVALLRLFLVVQRGVVQAY